MREYIQSKIQKINVTDKSLHYDGSVTICTDLIKEVGIEPYQKVDVINLNNGNRWSTYAILGKPGVFELNGGGARLGEIGDQCVILGYTLSSQFDEAIAIYVDEHNKVEKKILYTKPIMH
jgi:aspartate 1-decarboxylase